MGGRLQGWGESGPCCQACKPHASKPGRLTDTAAEGIGHIICADACGTSFGEEAAQMRGSMSARVPCGTPADLSAPHAPTAHAP